MKPIDLSKLNTTLKQLNDQLLWQASPAIEIVVCGGSALIATGLVQRTTQDLDIIALMDSGELLDSEPLPDYLLEAADKVGKMIHLPTGWLNNGPASQFNMGLPPGFQQRLSTTVIGEKLTVHYIGRIDQIYFKTYASADQGGYHVSDLKALKPTNSELIDAARWCMTQDVSEDFRMTLLDMFNQLGWQDVCDKI